MKLHSFKRNYNSYKRYYTLLVWISRELLCRAFFFRKVFVNSILLLLEGRDEVSAPPPRIQSLCRLTLAEEERWSLKRRGITPRLVDSFRGTTAEHRWQDRKIGEIGYSLIKKGKGYALQYINKISQITFRFYSVKLNNIE